MTADPLLEPQSELARGETRFIRANEKNDLISCCEQDCYLVVELPELRPSLRGRLAWLLEEAVERALELRGACPPGVGASASPELSLRDQLYRARLLGAPGFAIFVPTLEGITSRRGALDADDSASIRGWIESTRICALRFFLDVNDCMLGVYLEPITLAQVINGDTLPEKAAKKPVVVEWLDGKSSTKPDQPRRVPSPSAIVYPETIAQPEAEQESPVTLGRKPATTEEGNNETRAGGGNQVAQTESTASVLLSQPLSLPVPHPETEPVQVGPVEAPSPTDTETPSVSDSEPAPHPESETLVPPLPLDKDAVHEDEMVESEPASLNGYHPEGEGEARVTVEALEAPPERVSLLSPELGGVATTSASEAMSHSDPEDEDEVRRETNGCLMQDADAFEPKNEAVSEEAGETVEAAAPQESAAEAAQDVPLATAVDTAKHQQSLAEPVKHVISAGDPKRPLHPEASILWRQWMQKLDAARGPKPLNAIEHLFMTAYVPLADAFHRGIAGAEARLVLDSWSSSFARSYAEAFDAMRLRGRRPMMVLDIPEAAQRLARLHGARNVQLVLVDAMRFDIGLRVEQHLVAALGQQATLTDRFLLWSALPTTTAQQLELIGRGADGLKDGDVLTETPVLVARGRQAATPRRIRAGSRELLKLDLVEARLGEAGGPIASRLDQLAVEVSESLCSAFERMSPRTLVAVFGDHGFCLDATDTGSTNLRQGGASPEEVLVPGFAWLVGPTH